MSLPPGLRCYRIQPEHNGADIMDAAPRELTPKVSGLFERLIANDECVFDGVLEDRL